MEPGLGETTRAHRVEAVLASHDIDVLGLTEANLGNLPDGDSTIWADADHGYEARPTAASRALESVWMV